MHAANHGENLPWSPVEAADSEERGRDNHAEKDHERTMLSQHFTQKQGKDVLHYHRTIYPWRAPLDETIYVNRASYVGCPEFPPQEQVECAWIHQCAGTAHCFITSTIHYGAPHVHRHNSTCSYHCDRLNKPKNAFEIAITRPGRSRRDGSSLIDLRSWQAAASPSNEISGGWSEVTGQWVFFRSGEERAAFHFIPSA